MSPGLRQAAMDAIKELNEAAHAREGDPEIQTRIAAYEMTFKMQSSVPGLADLQSEPASVLEFYGVEPGKPSFAKKRLLARRLVERGVRFVQLYSGGWDHHGRGDQNLLTDLPNRCQQAHQASTALIKDLKQRGLLDTSLVVWGSEFGRTPMIQGELKPDDLGRDHQRTAFTIWMAGASIKPGLTLGATCDLGIRVTQDPVHVHDLQATILHLLGLDQLKLTFRFQGRDFHLTDVSGRVVTKLLA